MSHRRTIGQQVAGGGAWTPDASLAAWWYANTVIAAGESWIDSIGGAAIPMASNANGDWTVGLNTGLFVPTGTAIGAQSTYTFPTITAESEVTLATWVNMEYVEDRAGYLRLINWPYGGPVALTPHNPTGDMLAAVFNSGAFQYLAPDTEGTGWHHYAVTARMSDANGIAYVDGTPVGSCPVGDGGGTTLGIIKGSTDSNINFQLRLDDLQIYTTVLAESAILDIIANSPGSHA